MRRLLVNDVLSALEHHRTFWNDLREWFEMDFVGGDYPRLADAAVSAGGGATLIVRNASWFPPINLPCPQIALLQDILDGPLKTTQEAVLRSCKIVVFNSRFTFSKYWTAQPPYPGTEGRVIPLPVDFSTFEIGNPMGLQQALMLPDGCICWVGAHEGAAGHVKGYDIFLSVVRNNPDLHFVAVFKDSTPDSFPPNMRCFSRLSQADLARIMGACRVGLCTSRTESQHLAGIEMGACGLPLVAPEVGVYWKREIPGIVVGEKAMTTQELSLIIRNALRRNDDRERVRAYWWTEFNPGVVRSQWESLIKEVECSGRS